MQTFVEGAAEHRLQLLAECPAMAGGQMRFEVLPGPPDLDDGEVVQSIGVAQNFKADRAFILAAVGGKLMQYLGGFRGAIESQYVHVRDHV